ncbi:MAG: WG repeat-containing protein [Chitinophagaceae bacterium]|nr:MAG: WG repeat-containing protein [Chitinophagaceae bacterium]
MSYEEVLRPTTDENGKWGYFKSGVGFVIPCVYDSAGEFNSGYAVVGMNKTFGFINEKGQLVTELLYEDSTGFDNGYAGIKKKDKYAVINRELKIISRFEFEDIGPREPEVIAVRKDKLWAFITGEGEILTSFGYSSISYFSEGFSAVEKNKRWGFIDLKGIETIPCIYDKVHGFTDGLAAVNMNGKWGFIDFLGRLVIRCEYEALLTFLNGYAPIRLDGKWGIMDRKGNEVVKCQYYMASRFISNFSQAVKDSCEDDTKKEKYVLKEVENIGQTAVDIIILNQIRRERGIDSQQGFVERLIEIEELPVLFSKVYVRNDKHERSLAGYVDVTGKQYKEINGRKIPIPHTIEENLFLNQCLIYDDSDYSYEDVDEVDPFDFYSDDDVIRDAFEGDPEYMWNVD